jgi:hypothetical protein
MGGKADYACRWMFKGYFMAAVISQGNGMDNISRQYKV